MRSGRLAVAALAVVAVGLLLAGCRDGDPDAERSAAAAPSADEAEAAPVASEGCGDRGPAPGSSDRRLVTAGTEREYRRHVPAGYDPATPAPLVVDLHGLTMSASLEAALTGMEALADEEGFLVVTPQGLGDIPFWNYVSAGIADDDVSFLGALVAQVGADLCVDTSRVYATGISNGGLMSSALACRLPQVFAAVAPVAGVTFLDGCEDGPPVPYQATYGTADDVLPYGGGLGAQLQGFLSANPLGASAASAGDQQDQISAIAFPPVDDTLARWAARNGCADDPVEERVSPEVVRRSWPGCDDEAEVVLYLVEGGGHTWPGTPLLGGRGGQGDGGGGGADPAAGGLASVAGRTTDDISATELAWAFFERHRLDP